MPIHLIEFFFFSYQCWLELETQLDGHVVEPGSEREKRFNEGMHLHLPHSGVRTIISWTWDIIYNYLLDMSDIPGGRRSE